MTRQGIFKGFVAAVLSSVLAGLIVWSVTGYFGDRGVPQRVPPVVGHSLEDAMRVLIRRDFLPVEAERRITGERSPGTVLEQRPAPDHLAAVGATIELVVETESVEVPDLSGARIEEAIRRLSEARLAVGSVAVDPPQAQSTGTVVDQDPRFPARTVPGSTIAMVLEGLQAEQPDASPSESDNGGGRPTIRLDPRLLETIEFRRPRRDPPGIEPPVSEPPAEAARDIRVIRPRVLEEAVRRPQVLQDGVRLGLVTPSAPEPVRPLDGATLRGPTRRTTLEWQPVENAASYTVEVDFQARDQWVSETGRTYILQPEIFTTSHTFDFVGAPRGWWRVWAVNDAGIASPKSDWQTFRHLTR